MLWLLLQETVGDERAETLLRGLEKVVPHGRLFQRDFLPALEADKDESEVEESPPEKSDIEKLQESLQEREEREAELKQALEKAEAEIQEYRSELEAMNKELQILNEKVTEKSRDLRKINATVNQHSSDIEKTPLLIDQASKDLKMKLQEEDNRRSLFQETTNRKFVQVQSSIKTVKADVESDVTSKVETHIKAQIPQLQQHMKEELEKTAQQLRDERKKEMSDMRCEVLRQHEEREEVFYCSAYVVNILRLWVHGMNKISMSQACLYTISYSATRHVLPKMNTSLNFGMG